MTNKIQLFHFNNGSGGGVLSVIRNLVQYRQHAEIEHHIIYTINKDLHSSFSAPVIAGVVSTQVFYYSANWNFYVTAKKLAALLPSKEAVIVAHDWLELGACSNLGLQNPVVYFAHGDYEYYYELAIKNQQVIDRFIAVAQNISDQLQLRIPERTKDILYRRFPVPEAIGHQKDFPPTLNVVFIGRLTEMKGYPMLPGIAQQLNSSGYKLNWHIVGDNAKVKLPVWDKHIAVKFYGELPNDNVRELLRNMHLLLLPTLAEGMPLVLIEAMKAGVVPLVNDLPGGIRELVVDGTTGYKIQGNEPEIYVEKISSLYHQHDLLKELAANAAAHAQHLFEPVKNTRLIEDVLITAMRNAARKPAVKVYGSRLDQSWLPNIITKTIRKFGVGK
ncbi:MAG: glycosyltransferase family 4 protein [Ferruginibacter sp.]|nr:glycosyltransferase family 4 protein [Ferruginibacter sp.]